MRQNVLAKRQGYRRDSHGQPVNGEPEQLCQKHGRCVGTLRRIVTEEGAGPSARQCFPPWREWKLVYPIHGPAQPHTGTGTVTRTGTRPPPRCGKGPNAVGESGMALPGNSLTSTTWNRFHPGGWLIRAASDGSEDRTVVVVGDGNTAHVAKDCRLGG